MSRESQPDEAAAPEPRADGNGSSDLHGREEPTAGELRPGESAAEVWPEDGAMLAGETVRHYEILGPLGRGGMGVVYRARDRKLDRVVALKFLPPGVAERGEQGRRFLREAQVASGLDHPNICTVHAIEETADGRVFIAMAAYDGETLRDKLVRGALPLDQWLEIGLQIGRGLAAAHGRGIVHRDIKPANIMVTDDGLVKILDFGLSKSTAAGDPRSRLTRSGTILGTVAYLSPEQARGEEVSPSTDIWSFGAVLYEMATGRPPFEEAHDLSNLYGILHRDPIPPSVLRPGLPAHQEAIISRALAKDPAERYADIDLLIRDLQEMALEELATADEGSGATQRQAGRAIGPLLRTRSLARHEPGSPAPAVTQAAAAEDFADAPTVLARPDTDSAERARGSAPSERGEIRHGPTERSTFTSTGPAVRVAVGITLASLVVLIVLVAMRAGDARDAAPEPPETHGKLLEARKYLRLMDGASAMKVLSEGSDSASRSARVHLAQSEALALLGRETEALEKAEAAVSAAAYLRPEVRDLYYFQVADLKRDFVAAAEHLEAYWQYKEKSDSWGEGLRADRSLSLAELRARIGRPDLAFELLTLSSQAAPDDVRFFLLEGSIAPDAQDRLSAVRRALQLVRGAELPFLEARASLLEGRALRRMGETEAAAEALNRAAEIYRSVHHALGRAGALTVLGNLAWDRNDLTAARGHYEQAARLYGTVDNSRLRARALTNMALVLRELGDLGAATTIFRQTLELQRRLGDKSGEIFTLVNLAGTHQLGGRMAQAISATEEAEARAREVEDLDARGLVLEASGELHTLTGELQKAATDLLAMRELARSGGDRYALGQAEFRLGEVRHWEGNLGAAREHFESSLDHFDATGARHASSQVLDALGRTLLWIGDLETCRRVLEQARERATEAGAFDDGGLRLTLAELLLYEGRIAEATALVQRVLEEMAPDRQVFRAIRAREVKARILLAENRLEAAAEAIDLARTLADGPGMPTLSLPIELTAARIAAERGQADEARGLLQQTLARTTLHGYGVLDLKARSLLGRIELENGGARAGRARLEAVAAEAEARGLGRIAKQARAALEKADSEG